MNTSSEGIFHFQAVSTNHNAPLIPPRLNATHVLHIRFSSFPMSQQYPSGFACICILGFLKPLRIGTLIFIIS